MILKSIYLNSSLHTLNLTHNIISKSGLTLISNIYEKLQKACLFKISYNRIVDNSQNIDTILVHFDYEHEKEYVTVSKAKLDMHNRSASYKAKVLCCCAKDNKSVEVLDISDHDITNEGAKLIAKVIQGNMSLQKLDISHNDISDDGAIAIGEALRCHYNSNSMVTTNEGITNKDNIQNCTLQNLNMSYNNISSEGIVGLSDCLKNNNTLQQFTISWNDYETSLVLDHTQIFDMSSKHLGNVGTIIMSAFLFQNDKIQLKVLDISYNNIFDDGAVAISEYLRANKTLKKLIMSNNEITSLSVIKIIEAIQMNTTLRLLDISHNNISRCREVVTALSDHLKHNNTLQVLEISWNDTI